MSSPLSTATPSPAGFGSLVTRVLSAAGRGIAAVARALVHRRQVTAMLELDDRMLKDIGLVRADVLGALAGPMTSDPSTLLRLQSCARRTRQLAGSETYLRF